MKPLKEELLMEFGLSLNESKVYLSLLDQGFSSAAKIAEVSGVHRVNVYDSVSRLKEKGLIGEIMLDGKKCFQAAPPAALGNLLKEKEIKFQKILPELELLNHFSKPINEVYVYEGWDFIRNLFLQCLAMHEPIFALDVPRHGIQQLGPYFQEIIHKRRSEQQQMMYHIYSIESIDRIRFLNTLPFTEARYLERNQDGNVTTTICGEIVAIHVISEAGIQKPSSIMIKNKAIADAYRNHFWQLWEKAKIPEKISVET